VQVVLSVSEESVREKIRNYRDLKVWQKAVQLSKEIFLITTKFPANQQYGLKSQIERSVVSIASNIAEGSGRNGRQEFIYHLGVAQGSLFEVETQLIIAKEIGFLSLEEVEKLLKISEEISRMISGLIIKLKNKKH
jgi:four helix bundle protein